MGEAQSIEVADEVLAGRRPELTDFGKSCHRFSLNFTKTLSILYVHIVLWLNFPIEDDMISKAIWLQEYPPIHSRAVF